MLINWYLTTESQRENIFNCASSSKCDQALSCIGKENHRGSRLVHLLLASSLRAGAPSPSPWMVVLPGQQGLLMHGVAVWGWLLKVILPETASCWWLSDPKKGFSSD